MPNHGSKMALVRFSLTAPIMGCEEMDKKEQAIEALRAAKAGLARAIGVVDETDERAIALEVCWKAEDMLSAAIEGVKEAFPHDDDDAA